MLITENNSKVLSTLGGSIVGIIHETMFENLRFQEEDKIMATRRKSEREYYPTVERFLKKRFTCFITGQNKGTSFGRVDVVGLRDIGGDLAGTVEVIAVEVKAGRHPFSISTGQAYSYSVYADRCYLADLREESFDAEEIDIASKLGVGLLRIRSKRNVEEILSSPKYEPMVHMRSKMIENLGYARRMICRSVFQRGDSDRSFNKVSRKLDKALTEDKGYIYWLDELFEREDAQRWYNYNRRYVCRDCVRHLISPIVGEFE